MPARLTIQVHDELVFEVEDDFVSEFIKIAKQEMQDAIQLDVQLEVNLGAGDNWDLAH